MAQPAYIQWLIDLEHLVVSPDLAGQKNVVLGQKEGVVVKADFPAPPDPYAWVSVGTDEKPELIGIQELWVRAHLTTPMDTIPAINDPRAPTEEEMNEAVRLFDTATPIAAEVVSTFLDMAAQRHKRFLGRQARGLSGQQIGLQGVHARLYIGEPPQVAKVGQPTRVTAFVHRSDIPALTRTDADEIAKAITAGEQPNLAWQLYGRAHRLFVLEQNHRQAILEAAIAVEVGLDAAYRRVGKDPESVELLIKFVPLREQMLKGANAVVGQSYAAADAKGYSRIDKLVTERNAIVHEGASGNLSESDLRECLGSVADLLTWLDARS